MNANLKEMADETVAAVNEVKKNLKKGFKKNAKKAKSETKKALKTAEKEIKKAVKKSDLTDEDAETVLNAVADFEESINTILADDMDDSIDADIDVGTMKKESKSAMK